MVVVAVVCAINAALTIESVLLLLARAFDNVLIFVLFTLQLAFVSAESFSGPFVEPLSRFNMPLK